MTPTNEELNEDGSALGRKALQINPEVLRGITPLEDLDKLEVVLVQQATPSWTRWTEGLTIHVVGSGIFAAIVLVVGLMLAGAPKSTEGLSVQHQCCVDSPASAPTIAD